ncbi:MAG: ATP-binding cassette domain-containing protein [Planctomycetota bacterium]
MSGPPVFARGVTGGYGAGAVLRGVDLEVPAGEAHAVLGTSGCGKTTLLRMLVGLLRPLAGEIRILGEPIHALSEADRPRLLRRVGLLFQGGALFGSLSVLENVLFPLREHAPGLPERALERTALAKLEAVGLREAASKMPSDLSGGMKKRVALARALVLDPEILFLDEPTAGLDPVTAAGLDALILRVKRLWRVTLVIVTHDLGSARRVADRATLLVAGEVAASGTFADLDASADPRVQGFLRPEAPSPGEAAREPAAADRG